MQIKKTMEREPIIIENDGFDIKRVLNQFLQRWYWYLLTIPVCLAIGVYLNKTAIPTYSVASKILIHVDEDQVVYSEDAISGLNFMFRAKTVNNEIAVLKSRDLIARAIDSLNLNVSFYGGVDARNEIYFDELPFEIMANYDNAHLVKGVAFKVVFQQDGSYSLWINEEDKGEGNLGETIYHNGFTFIIDRRAHHWFTELPKESVTFYINSNEDIINLYQNKIQVFESDKDTDAITISIDETIPDRGRKLLHSLIKTYIVQVLEDRKRIAGNTYDFIDERIRLNFGHLDSLEYAIDRYKRNHNITDPSLESKYILEGIKKFEIELNDAETQRDIVDELVDKSITDPRGELDLSIPNTMLGVTDPLLNDLIIDLNQKQYELRTLSKTVQKDNPLYAELHAQVEDLRASIMVDLLNLQENMHTTVSYIEEQIAEYKARLAEIGYDERDLTSMERLRNNKEALYIYLLKKREEAALILASELMDTWVIEQPYVSAFFFTPKRGMVLIVALFMGLFIPTFIIILWMLLDGKVRSAEDMRTLIKAPFVGAIALDKIALKARDGQQQITTKLKEEYKRIAFNLRFIKEDYKVLMVSSMGSNDGKTFTSVNLGQTHALLGKKTCVVDIDLRRSSIKSRVNLQLEKGLTDHLMGDAGFDEIIEESTELAGTYFVSAGSQAIDPTQLLIGDRLTAFIERLKKEFDYVILDTAPMGVVSDAMLVSRFADINIVVVRQDNTKKEKLKHLKELMDNKRLGDVAMLYNGARSDMSDLQYVYGSPRKNRFKIRELIWPRLARS